MRLGVRESWVGYCRKENGVLLVILAGRRGAWACYLELGIGREIYIISLRYGGNQKSHSYGATT